VSKNSIETRGLADKLFPFVFSLEHCHVREREREREREKREKDKKEFALFSLPV